MRFSWEVRFGDILAVSVLVITFFSKSGSWFFSIDKRLTEILKELLVIRKENIRCDKNAHTVQRFLNALRLQESVSNKLPEINWIDREDDLT